MPPIILLLVMCCVGCPAVDAPPSVGNERLFVSEDARDRRPIETVRNGVDLSKYLKDVVTRSVVPKSILTKYDNYPAADIYIELYNGEARVAIFGYILHSKLLYHNNGTEEAVFVVPDDVAKRLDAIGASVATDARARHEAQKKDKD